MALIFPLKQREGESERDQTSGDDGPVALLVLKLVLSQCSYTFS